MPEATEAEVVVPPPIPTITGIVPTNGSAAGGTSVTITGENFVDNTTVTVGGVAATSVTVVNSTTITCTTPAGTVGTTTLIVNPPGCFSAPNTTFTYGAAIPAPSVTAISPTSGSTAGGTSVTLTGTDFTGATGVTIGGVAATGITVVNTTTITCTTPAGTAGTASVVVTTPNGANAANTLFAYATPEASTATITYSEVGSDVVATGSGSIDLAGVTPAAAATFSGTVRGNAGLASVGPATSQNSYTGVSGPVSFGTGALQSATSATGDAVSVLGSSGRFYIFPAYVSRAAFSGTATFAGKTLASLGLTPGTYVYTYGSGGTAGSFTVQINPPAPTVTAIAPTSGSPAGGTSVTITGTSFTGATGVTIGGVAATGVTVVSATSITCTTPAGTVGTASVVVTTPNGSNGANTLYSYVVPNAAPTVASAIASFTADEDAAPVVRNLAAVFTDTETAAVNLTYAVVGNTNTALVTATLTQGTNLTLAFTANGNGSSQISVSATDAGSLAVTNTFVVSVTAVNDAPSVTFAQSTVTVAEDAGAQSTASFATFSAGPANESSQALSGYTVTVDNAALFSAAPALNTSGVLTFTAAANSNGTATVTVVVQDNGGTGLVAGGLRAQGVAASGAVDKATNTFTIVVTAVNDAPVAVNNSYTVSQGDVLTVTAAGVLANDTDIENDTLTATRLTDGAQGPVVLNANGGFTYTPNTNFYGTDSFTYRASDASSNSNPATVSILVYARPTNAVPIAQTVFSGATLRFSATNLPVANGIRVGDPDSTALTVSLTVTNGTVTVSNLTGLTFANGKTNGTNVVLTGLTADVNNALVSLAYASKVNFFGTDTLHITTTDEGGRTNRGNWTVSILVEIPTLGGVPKVSLESLNDPMTGRMITNVTGLVMDTNLVQGVSFDSVSNVVNVLPVGGQDGSTNRSTITVRVQFSDGTSQDVVVPVIIYQPLLAATTNSVGTYDSTFGTPLFNYQNSLYEQKVRVQNNTPFDFTAVRITATNLPATVTLQNATVTNGGQVYIDYNLPILSGSNVTLKLEYFSSDLRTFTPGLKLDLLNTTRTNSAPPGAVMTSVAPKTGYAPDGLVKNYLYFPSKAGQRYYVQYFDTVTVPQVWKTSGVVIQGTGLDIHWMDDGPPSTETPPGPLRFYRVVTDR